MIALAIINLICAAIDFYFYKTYGAGFYLFLGALSLLGTSACAIMVFSDYE